MGVGIYSCEGGYFNISVEPEIGHKLKIGQIVTIEINWEQK